MVVKWLGFQLHITKFNVARDIRYTTEWIAVFASVRSIFTPMTFIKRSPHLPPTPRLNYVLISPFGFNWLPMYHVPIISLIHQAFRERVVPAEERTKPATVIAFTWNYFSVWSWRKFDGENWYTVLADVQNIGLCNKPLHHYMTRLAIGLLID